MTLTGWVALIVGLLRMAMPEAPQLSDNASTYAVLTAMGAFGMILSFKGYWSE